MAFLIQFVFQKSLNKTIVVFSDPLCIWHEILVVFCGICPFHSFYPVNKTEKHLVEQIWPYEDKCVALYRKFPQKGLDFFFFFGEVLLVGYSYLFLPTLLKEFLSLKFTITHSLRGQILVGGNLEN